MNLLLLEEADRRQHQLQPSEFQPGEQDFVLRGPRADHVRRVLGKSVGESLKCGLVGVGTGLGRITWDNGSTLGIELADVAPCRAPRLEIILALPRPKALSRVLQAVASFGVARLDLIGAYRVEKAYFDSPRLSAERLREDLWLGCEQGVQPHLPEVHVERRFGSFMEGALLERPPLPAFLLHPQAALPLPPRAGAGPLRLALGPEGGWTAGELAVFTNHGFEPITLGPAVLRTEVAVAAALGQLLLLEVQHEAST